MRLLLATLAMVLGLTAAAFAQAADLRAPDQVAPTQQPTAPADLRAPDRVAPTQQPTAPADLRAPDQVAPTQQPTPAADQRAPDQQAPGRVTPPVPAPAVDDGPAAIFFVLIGLGAALVLLAGGYLGVRFRHRVAVADDLVTH